MQELPHHYHASAVADGDFVSVSSPDASIGAGYHTIKSKLYYDEIQTTR